MKKVIVAGKFSWGFVKIRVALEDHAKAEVTGTTAGKFRRRKRKLECLEIVKDQAQSLL